MNISHLISSYGYVAVFLVVGIESLGIPLPGETALIAAGIVAGKSHSPSPFAIWGVGAAGAIIGDNIGFLIGDKGGYRLVRRYGHNIRLDQVKLKVGRYAFDRHGVSVVFFGRFVSVLRTYAAFLAGTNKMRWRKFLPANVAGGIVWSGAFTWASYEAGATLQRLSGTLDWILGGVAIVVLVAVLLAVRQKTEQLEEVAQRAYPEEI